MKNLIIVMLMVVILSGCGYKFVKKEEVTNPTKPIIEEQTKEDEQTQDGTTFTVKVSNDRTMRSILQEILSNGELINKDVHARRFGDYEYSWEMWLIKENRTGDYHSAIIENGILIDISPVNDLEDARKRFKPYGGWKDVE